MTEETNFQITTAEAEGIRTEAQLYRRFAEEHLAAAGFGNPTELLRSLYEEIMPSDETFEHEAKQFEGEYLEAMEKAAYLRIIEERAGEDALLYRKLFELGRTSEGRMANGGRQYSEAVASISAFNPSSTADYYARFEDLPEYAHKHVYMKALQMAEDRLSGTRTC